MPAPALKRRLVIDVLVTGSRDPGRAQWSSPPQLGRSICLTTTNWPFPAGLKLQVAIGLFSIIYSFGEVGIANVSREHVERLITEAFGGELPSQLRTQVFAERLLRYFMDNVGSVFFCVVARSLD
jgi:hypothetical protein